MMITAMLELNIAPRLRHCCPLVASSSKAHSNSFDHAPVEFLCVPVSSTRSVGHEADVDENRLRLGTAYASETLIMLFLEGFDIVWPLLVAFWLELIVVSTLITRPTDDSAY